MLLISANACVASENEFLYQCKHLYICYVKVRIDPLFSSIDGITQQYFV